MAATYAMSGFFGWTFSWPIWPTSFSPAGCQVLSGVGRLVNAAAQNHVRSDRLAAGADVDHVRDSNPTTSIAPIDPVGNWPSVIGDHVMP